MTIPTPQITPTSHEKIIAFVILHIVASCINPQSAYQPAFF
jgi:hypothetical protein